MPFTYKAHDMLALNFRRLYSVDGNNEGRKEEVGVAGAATAARWGSHDSLKPLSHYMLVGPVQIGGRTRGALQ